VGGCRNEPLVDRHVTEAVFAKIDLETTGAVAELPAWAGQADLNAVTAEIGELTEAWKARPKRISSARALLPDLEAEESGQAVAVPRRPGTVGSCLRRGV
jgi:site-specific DNA recombinase